MVSPTNVTRPGEHRFDIKPIFDKTLRDDDAINAIVIEDDTFVSPKRTSSDGDFADALEAIKLGSSKRSSSTSPAGKRTAKKQKTVELDDDAALEVKIEDMFCDIFTDPESVLRTYMLRQFRFSPKSRAVLIERGVPVELLNDNLRNEEALTHVVVGKDETDRIAYLERDCRKMIAAVGKWQSYNHFRTEAELATSALQMVRNKALELQSVCHTDVNGTVSSVHEYARRLLKTRCEYNGLRRYKNKFYAWKPKQ